MARKNQFSSPFECPYPLPDKDGDRRDIHDSNPATNLGVPHEKGRDSLSLNFVEETDGHPGARIGHTHTHVPDILATAMGGQRRSATGQYESEPSIHKTQADLRREFEEKMKAGFPHNPHEEGKE